MTIKELRILTGMTQKAFAAYFSVSKRAVESWEGGQRDCPEYLIDLMGYKLAAEGMIPGGDGSTDPPPRRLRGQKGDPSHVRPTV